MACIQAIGTTLQCFSKVQVASLVLAGKVVSRVLENTTLVAITYLHLQALVAQDASSIPPSLSSSSNLVNFSHVIVALLVLVSVVANSPTVTFLHDAGAVQVAGSTTYTTLFLYGGMVAIFLVN